jgi:hypothetical protein
VELPVSRKTVEFRWLDGNDELTILEARGGIVEQAALVLTRLAAVTSEAAPSANGAFWRRMTVTDFEAALLGLRRFLFGDTMECLFRCMSPLCGAKIESKFSISVFLETATPRVSRGIVESTDRPGWFLLERTRGGDLCFRLPAVEDQISVVGKPDARRLLANRCIESQRRNALAIAAAERAMEAMAPLVSKPLEGLCPECRARVTMPLHVPTFVLQELRMAATGIHAEIHTIAKAYHWDEASILAMPPSRRQAYVDSIRGDERLN